MFPRDPGTREFVRQLIRRKAERLVRLRAIRPHDQEDLEQELHMEIQRSSHVFDASRGTPEAFSRTVIDSRAANYVRNRFSPKRFSADCTSTERTCVSGAKRPVHARCGTRRLSDEELQDLRLDLELAMKALPPELRRVAELLMKHSKAEAARQSGLPRMTFYTSVAAVKRRFQAAHLERYL